MAARGLFSVLAAGAVVASLFVISGAGSRADEPPRLVTVPLAAADEPGSVVEDYGYPDRDRILAERGITLIKGDGHILLTDCVPGRAGQMAVASSAFLDHICFKVTGAAGYLSMSIPEVFSIKGDDHPATAMISVDGGAPQTIEIKKNVWNPINKGDSATLLELKTSS